jgi:CheY-like chemotaxis protein
MLLCDDGDPTLLADLLELEGYTVIFVTSEETAHAKLRAGPLPKVVVVDLDHEPPRLLEIVIRLRAASVAVVVFTSWTVSLADLRRAAHAVVLKPRTEELLAAISSANR